MRKLSILIICLLPLVSCEKVWVEDLQEKAYDTIRGTYEIESAVWEEAEPIDINGDGHITNADRVMMNNHLISAPELTDPVELWCADINGDGRLNIADTARLYSHV